MNHVANDPNVIVDMCCSCNKSKSSKVYKVHDTNGDVMNVEQTDNLENLPEHVDNPHLNRNVQNGILGFRYENRKCTIIVYSSVEARTFCILMKIKPLR